MIYGEIIITWCEIRIRSSPGVGGALRMCS